MPAKKTKKPAKTKAPTSNVVRSGDDAVQKTLHDLRVHQIELEASNEELRRTHAELDAVRARYFDLYNLAPVGYCTVSEAGLILEANLAAASLLGVARGVLVKKAVTAFIAPSDQDIFNRHSRQLFTTGAPQAYELRMVRPDGTVFWARLAATAAQDADGASVSRVVLSDDPERERAEKALRSKEERYRRLIAAMTMGFALHEIVCDASGKPVDYVTLEVNATFEQLLGVTREAVVGQKVSAFMSPEELEHWLGIFAPVALTGPSTHYEMYSPVNHRYFAGHVFCPEPGRFATVFTDITERRLAEDEVRTILRTTMDGYYLVDMAGKFLDTNDAYCGMIGYSREELLTMGVKDIEAVDTDERIRQRIQRIMETGYVRFETQHRRKDGRVIDIEASVNILKDGGGKLVVFMRDITERKRAAEALSETSERYRVLFEQSPDGIVVLDPTTARFLEFNDVAHRQLGYSREEFAQLSISDLDVVETPEETRAHIARVISDGRSDFETRQRTKQGETRNIRVTAQVIPVQGRDVYHCVWRDVTERKRAESRLSEEQKRLSSILATVGDPIFVKNNEHRFVLANRAFYDMLGLEEEDVIGRTLGESLPADEMRHFLAVDRRVLDTGVPETCEEVLTARGGVQLTIVTRKTRFLDDAGNAFLVGAIHDITDSRKAEEAAGISEERLRVGLNTANVAVFSQDLDLRYVWMYQPQLGYAPEQVVGHTDAELLPPQAAQQVMELKRRALEGGRKEHAEVAVTVGDRTSVFTLVAEPVRDASGAITGLVGATADITERKRAEEALSSSLALIEATLESTANGILVVSPDGTVLKANRVFAELWHIPDDIFASGDDGRLVGHVLSQLSDPDEFLAGVKTLYDRPQAESADLLAFKDGRVFERTSRPMLVGGEAKARVWSFLDITERKRAEEENQALQAQLHQAQKAESLGRMAGAIAHNYNNLLGAVLLNLELAQGKLPSDAGARKYLADATKASQRAAEISHQMLAYLGQSTGRREAVDLGEVCREALLPLRSSLLEHEQITTEFPAEGVFVRADAAQLRRVLTSLLMNAAEAIGDGAGDIAVAIDVIAASDIPTAVFHPADWTPEAGTYACVSVIDSGCGMSPETLDRLFDPFFSTKFTGRGLGVPVVMGIVQSHGGACSVVSELGRGTTFRVYLPLATEQPRQARAAARVGTGGAEGRGLVLVVDDEPMLRDLTRTVLEYIGYTVVEAGDGAAAVEVFRQHRDEIRCVLCDVTMPGMDGWATLGALRKLAPDVPVILASGYDEAQVMAGEHVERPQAFLHKPYVTADLKVALAAALKER